MPNSAVVGVLRALLTLDKAEFVSGLRKSQDELKAFSRETQTIARQASALGASLTRSITLPFLGAGAAAAMAAVEFESSLAGVRKTVKATDEEFDKLSAGFRGLAKQIPVNVNELNRLGEAAGALGIPKAEIVDFTRVMALLGVTTNVTSDRAAEDIAKIQNIFGAAGKSTENFASALVALGNDGASTESQILEMAARIAGAGNAIGMTQGQVLGFASALSSVGLEAEMGGSAISRVFVDIAAAVSQGGEAVVDFARVAGQPVAEFSRLFKEDAASAVNAFINGLARIKSSGGDLLATLEALGFTEIRVRDTLLRAAGAGDLLTRALDVQSAAWQRNRALTDEANERFKTTASQLTLLWNAIRDVGITIGTALLPLIQATVEVFNSWMPTIEAVAKAFAGLSPTTQAVIVGLGLLVAAAGPVLFVAGQLVQAVSLLAGAFTSTGLASRVMVAGMSSVGVTATATATTVATAATTIRSTILGLLGPIGLAAGALGLLYAASQKYHAASGMTEEQIRKEIESLRAVGGQMALSRAASLEAALAEREHASAVGVTSDAYQDLKDRLSGASIAKEVEQISKAVDDLTRSGQLTPEAIKRIATELQVLQQQGATLPANLQAIADSATSSGKALTAVLAETRTAVAKLTAEQRANIQAGIDLGRSNEEIVKSLNRLFPTLRISESAVAMVRDQLQQTGKAARETAKDFAELSGETAKLEALELSKALGSGRLDLGKLTEESQRSVADTLRAGADAWRAQGQAVEASVAKQLAAVTKLRTVPDLLKSNAAEMRAAMAGIGDGWATKVKQDLDDINAGMQRNLGVWTSASKASSALQRKLSGDTLKAVLADIKTEYDEKRDALNRHSSFYQEALNEIARAESMAVQIATREWQFGQAKTRDEMQKTADHDAEVLANMLAHREEFTREAIEQQREIAEKSQRAVEGGGGFFSDMGDGLKSAALDLAQQLPGILQDAFSGNFQGDELGKQIGAAIGGAIGGAFGGPLGASLGAAAGQGIAEMFRTDGEDVVRRVGHDWGVLITEEMGNAIAETAHFLFPTTGSEGNLQAAEIFHLVDILESAGGLDTANIESFTSRLRDTFSMLETGVFDTAQATRVLNENFSEFAAFFEGGLISNELREIVALAQQAGLESEAVRQFLSDQASNVQRGLSGVIAGALPTDEDDKITGDLGQEEFSRLQRLASAAFEAAVAAGQPFLQTLLAMGDDIGRLNQAAEQFGLTQIAAFGDLSALQSFFAANEGLADSIDGVNSMLTGLYNSNRLTQESFSDLGAVAVQNFQEMVAGGLSNEQAMLAQQDTLQTLWEIVQDGSHVVDEQTAALLEQAEAAGMVGESHMDAQERATRAMEKAATAMQRVGDVLAEVFGIAGDEAEEFADRATAAIRSIPTTVPISFLGEYSGEVPVPHDQLHTGGMVTAHRGLFLGPQFKPGEVFAKLLTGEGVLSRLGMSKLGGAGVLNALNAGQSLADPFAGMASAAASLEAGPLDMDPSSVSVESAGGGSMEQIVGAFGRYTNEVKTAINTIPILIESAVMQARARA